MITRAVTPSPSQTRMGFPMAAPLERAPDRAGHGDHGTHISWPLAGAHNPRNTWPAALCVGEGRVGRGTRAQIQRGGFHPSLAGGGASQRSGQGSWLQLTLPWALRCSGHISRCLSARDPPGLVHGLVQVWSEEEPQALHKGLSCHPSWPPAPSCKPHQASGKLRQAGKEGLGMAESLNRCGLEAKGKQQGLTRLSGSR